MVGGPLGPPRVDRLFSSCYPTTLKMVGDTVERECLHSVLLLGPSVSSMSPRFHLLMERHFVKLRSPPGSLTDIGQGGRKGCVHLRIRHTLSRQTPRGVVYTDGKMLPPARRGRVLAQRDVELEGKRVNEVAITDFCNNFRIARHSFSNGEHMGAGSDCHASGGCRRAHFKHSSDADVSRFMSKTEQRRPVTVRPPIP